MIRMPLVWWVQLRARRRYDKRWRRNIRRTREWYAHSRQDGKHAGAGKMFCFLVKSDACHCIEDNSEDDA